MRRFTARMISGVVHSKRTTKEKNLKAPRELVSEHAMRRERRIEIIAGVLFSIFSLITLILAAVCVTRLHAVVATQGMALADVANPDLYLGALQAGGGYAIWGVVLGLQAMQHFSRAAQTRQINALRCLLQELESKLNSTEGVGAQQAPGPVR